MAERGAAGARGKVPSGNKLARAERLASGGGYRRTIVCAPVFRIHFAMLSISSSLARPTQPSEVSKVLTRRPSHFTRRSGPCTPTAPPVKPFWLS